MSAFLDVIVYMFLSYLGLRFLQGINILPKFLSEKRYQEFGISVPNLLETE